MHTYNVIWGLQNVHMLYLHKYAYVCAQYYREYVFK